MQPSGSFCRTQEKRERERASSTKLDHVRIIASRAADAWSREAVAAERREKWPIRIPSIPEIISQRLLEFDRWASENPDRRPQPDE